LLQYSSSKQLLERNQVYVRIVNTIIYRELRNSISNNPSFHLKHLGVWDSSDGSGETSYPLMENRTRPIAQPLGCVEYIPCAGYYTLPLIHATCRFVYYARHSGVRLSLLCVRNVVTYTHHQNDMNVTHFAWVAVMQWPFTQSLAMFMPFFCR
jgi:hypothetical protein